jgi:endonuclease/exonuclease/phosphatase family metal-dependent hydrolase
VTPTGQFRLLTYNVRHGGVGREEAIARVVAACAPDVVVLQEATRPDVVERIAARTGMADARAYKRQSLAFISREPVAHAATYKPRFSRHAFIEIVPAGERVRIFGVHLSAIHAAWTERRRTFELRSLLRGIAHHQHGFHLLAGDFNTLAPAEILDIRRLPPRLRPFVWLSGGQIKWKTIQLVLDAGYVDVFRQMHPGRPGHTMPTRDPHVRLDYVFVPQAFADRVASCDVVTHPDAAAASDHFPVVASFTIDP